MSETHENEKEEDRLSDLPDCVLLHILSFLNVKYVVQTCILSTRWKNIWKLLPTLRLRPSYFGTMYGFNQFVTQILSLRDDSTALYSLIFSSSSVVEPQLLERILKYAVSQNLQVLRIALLHNIEHIPDCIFSCHTLTSLKLYARSSKVKFFPNYLNLPALTFLSIRYFVFRGGDDGRAEPFSRLKKLNSLIIRFCQVFDAQNLCISSVTLTDLTIQPYYKRNYLKIELFAPSLSKFAYAGTSFEKLCGSHLCSVEHVNIDAYMYSYNAEPPSNLLSWLRELTEIKSLTVTSTTLQVLSLVPNLLKDKLNSLRNLKSLTIKMKGISSGSSKRLIDGRFVKLQVKYQEKIAKFGKAIFKEGSPAIPDGIVDFLLQNSPSAKVHIIN